MGRGFLQRVKAGDKNTTLSIYFCSDACLPTVIAGDMRSNRRISFSMEQNAAAAKHATLNSYLAPPPALRRLVPAFSTSNNISTPILNFHFQRSANDSRFTRIPSGLSFFSSPTADKNAALKPCLLESGNTSRRRRCSRSDKLCYQLTVDVSAPVCSFPRVYVRRSLVVMAPSWPRMEIAVPPVSGKLFHFQARASFCKVGISFFSRIPR